MKAIWFPFGERLDNVLSLGTGECVTARASSGDGRLRKTDTTDRKTHNIASKTTGQGHRPTRLDIALNSRLAARFPFHCRSSKASFTSSMCSTRVRSFGRDQKSAARLHWNVGGALPGPLDLREGSRLLSRGESCLGRRGCPSASVEDYAKAKDVWTVNRPSCPGLFRRHVGYRPDRTPLQFAGGYPMKP